MSDIQKFLNDETGASAAEYALILALVAVAIIVGLGLLGTAINGTLSNVASNISGASA